MGADNKKKRHKHLILFLLSCAHSFLFAHEASKDFHVLPWTVSVTSQVKEWAKETDVAFVNKKLTGLKTFIDGAYGYTFYLFAVIDLGILFNFSSRNSLPMNSTLKDTDSLLHCW